MKHRMLTDRQTIGTIIVLTVIWLSVGSALDAALAADKYVHAVDGNNASAGTAAAPWKTIEYAVSSSGGADGDTIKLMSDVNEPNIVLMTRAYTIEPDANCVAPAVRTLYCKTGWNALTLIANGKGLTCNRLNFATLGAGGLLKLQTAGTPGGETVTFTDCQLTTSGVGVLVQAGSATTNLTFTRMIATLDPNGVSTPFLWVQANLGTVTLNTCYITSSPTSHFVTLNASSVIDRMDVTDCNMVHTTSAAGYYTFSSAAGSTGYVKHLRYTGNSVAGVRHGLYINSAVYYPYISNNTFTASGAAGAVSCIINLGQDDDANAPGRPLVATVRNNTMAFTGTGMGHCINIGTGADGAEVVGNTIGNGDFGVVIKANGAHVHHNTINFTDPNCQGGILFAAGATACLIEHNTVYAAYGRGIASAQPITLMPTYNTVRRNIFAQKASNTSPVIDDRYAGSQDGNMDTFVIDENCYFPGTTAKIAKLNYGGSPPTELATLATLQAGWATYAVKDASSYGICRLNDENSIAADPLFVNADAGNFRLQSASPCLLGSTAFRQAMGAWGYPDRPRRGIRYGG